MVDSLTLFQSRPLAEPGGIQPVFLVACALFVVHELGHGNAQLLLDGLRIEAGAVGNLDRAAGAVQGGGERVVAHHPDGFGCGRRGQGAISGSRQQQIAVDHIVAFEGCRFTSLGERPKLLDSVVV